MNVLYENVNVNYHFKLVSDPTLKNVEDESDKYLNFYDVIGRDRNNLHSQPFCL